jgi:hypothetical protein
MAARCGIDPESGNTNPLLYPETVPARLVWGLSGVALCWLACSAAGRVRGRYMQRAWRSCVSGALDAALSSVSRSRCQLPGERISLRDGGVRGGADGGWGRVLQAPSPTGPDCQSSQTGLPPTCLADCLPTARSHPLFGAPYSPRHLTSKTPYRWSSDASCPPCAGWDDASWAPEGRGEDPYSRCPPPSSQRQSGLPGFRRSRRRAIN